MSTSPTASRLLICLALLLSLSAVVARPQESTATGIFESQGVSFNVVSAYAFKDKSFLDEGEDAILVAVSNAHFVPDMVNRYYDRRWLLENYHRDDQTGVVFFEFKPSGTFRGLSYQLTPGNGCGYCSSGEMKSTVAKKGDRLVGRLSSQESERPYDIEIDVPIQTNDYGESAPLDGALAKSYLEYHQAMVAGDESVLRQRFSEYQLGIWQELAAEGNGQSFLSSWHEDHPQEVTVKQVFEKPEDALILIEGKWKGIEVKGEALLVKQGGTWRVDDHVLQMK